MREELEKKLIDEFPTFFRDIYGDPMKTCMAWGCAHDDGWYNLLYETCKKVAALDKNKKFYFLQIKEKFGGLRLYCAGGNKEIYKITNTAEEESYKICEHCGTKENVTVEGSWILALCKDCRGSRNKERESRNVQ